MKSIVRKTSARAKKFTCLAILALFPAAAHLADAPPPSAASAGISDGDAHWARRAEGAAGALANPQEIDAAVAAYRAALAPDPELVEGRWKLLRALYFRGVYCGADSEARKKFFGDARKIGDDGIARLEKAIGHPNGTARAAALRKISGSGPLYFWTSACWGEWALAYGKFAAAREGAAGTIRDLAQTVIDVEPGLEEGGGYRVLGRLHHQSPKIPFVTGWVSRDEALSNFRKAHDIAPLNKTTQLFLAEAILDYQPGKKDEAIQLLSKCANDPPRAELLIEETHYAQAAKKKMTEVK